MCDYLKGEKKHNFPNIRGFSLIELMVSLTIFSILMVVSVGTLLTLIDANAKAQALSSATTNLSFALDSITREIRTGHYYYCKSFNDENRPENLPEEDNMPGGEHDGNCRDSDDANFIAFVRDRDGKKIGYRLKDGSIEQRVQEANNGSYETSWEKLTSDDITIETFRISTGGSVVYEATSPETDQPVVTLHIKGRVANKNGLETETDFNIQTLIVQRRLDQV